MIANPFNQTRTTSSGGFRQALRLLGRGWRLAKHEIALHYLADVALGILGFHDVPWWHLGLGLVGLRLTWWAVKYAVRMVHRWRKNRRSDREGRRDTLQ